MLFIKNLQLLTRAFHTYFRDTCKLSRLLKFYLNPCAFQRKSNQRYSRAEKKVILEFNGQLKMIRDNITIDVAIETIAT